MTALPTSASRGRSAAPSAGSWRRTMSRGAVALDPPTAASAGSPAVTASRTSTRDPGQRGGAIGQAGGRDDVRRRVDELARDVRPTRDGLCAARDRAPSPGSCRTARSARRRPPGPLALPAARVVAAEDRALDDRVHLAVLGDREGVVDRPRDACRRRGSRAPPGPPRSGGLRGLSPSSATRAMRRARSSRLTCTNATGSGSAAERTSRPSNAASSRRTPQPARGHGEDVGLHLGRRGRRRQLDVRSPVSIIARCALGFSARPPAAASRSGTATARRARPPAPERRASADAVVARDPRGRGSVVPRQRLAGPPPAARGARRRGRAAASARRPWPGSC